MNFIHQKNELDNGIEEDENGNLVFNPQKFAAGFIGGALATKIGTESIARLAKNPKARNVLERIKQKAYTISPKNHKAENMIIKTQETKPYKELRLTLRDKLKRLAGVDIVNKATGLKGRITNDEINKIISVKAVRKSQDNGFTKEARR